MLGYRLRRVVLAERNVCRKMQCRLVSLEQYKLKKNDDDDLKTNNSTDHLMEMAQQELSHEQFQNLKVGLNIAVQKRVTRKSLDDKWNVPSTLHQSFSPIANTFHEQKDKTLGGLLFDRERFGMTYDQFLLEEAYNCGLEMEKPKVLEYENNRGKEKIFETLKIYSPLHGLAITPQTNTHILKKGAKKNKLKVTQEKKRVLAKEAETMSKAQIQAKIIRYVSGTKKNCTSKHFLQNAKLFGQPLVFDCRFNSKFNTRMGKCLSQINRGYAENKGFHDAFHFVFCNLPKEHTLVSTMRNKFEKVENGVTFTDKSYLRFGDDILPREKLVYLSPDAKTEMTDFQHDKIYIIGTMVDQPERPNLTHAIAMSEDIQCQKLPLTKYLKWGGVTGRKSLTICTIVQILLTLKVTGGNWIEALKNIPVRFHCGLTSYAESLVDDPYTIARYQHGEIVKLRKQKQEKPDDQIRKKKFAAGYFGKK